MSDIAEIIYSRLLDLGLNATREDAPSIIQALKDAGHVVVPREPLEVVLEAADFGNEEQSPPGCWDGPIETIRAAISAWEDR